MRIARVIGNVVATVKDPQLEGFKLLLIEPMGPRGPQKPLLALDGIGAGPGEWVYFCRGKEASFVWRPREVPTDAAIVGILDPAANHAWQSRWQSGGNKGKNI